MVQNVEGLNPKLEMKMVREGHLAMKREVDLPGAEAP
jgi:hypothetical protein